MSEALTLIERVYYMEGKSAEWRAARMNAIARDAQDDKDLSPHRRLFPREHLRTAVTQADAGTTEGGPASD